MSVFEFALRVGMVWLGFTTAIAVQRTLSRVGVRDVPAECAGFGVYCAWVLGVLAL